MNIKHHAKKSLGQNFLKSKMFLQKITEAGEILPTDTILEIGPGKGALTEKLLEKARKVIAVEKDESLIRILEERFKKEIEDKKLFLISADILNYEPRGKYKIIANIPYNITGAILKKFLTAKTQPERMVLLLQHEVAKRIIANDKKETVLSISVKAYGEPKIIDKVSARYFSPAPKVNSAILLVKNISREFFIKNKLKEEDFWLLVKKGFAHKRKKLSGNLKKEKISLPISFQDKRAENLTLEDWKTLASLL